MEGQRGEPGRARDGTTKPWKLGVRIIFRRLSSARISGQRRDFGEPSRVMDAGQPSRRHVQLLEGAGCPCIYPNVNEEKETGRTWCRRRTHPRTRCRLTSVRETQGFFYQGSGGGEAYENDGWKDDRDRMEAIRARIWRVSRKAVDSCLIVLFDSVTTGMVCQSHLPAKLVATGAGTSS